MIESNATPAYDKEQALRLYVEQSEMDALLQEDTDRYREPLQRQVVRLVGLSQSPVSMRCFRELWTLCMPLRWLD